MGASDSQESSSLSYVSVAVAWMIVNKIAPAMLANSPSAVVPVHVNLG